MSGRVPWRGRGEADRAERGWRGAKESRREAFESERGVEGGVRERECVPSPPALSN